MQMTANLSKCRSISGAKCLVLFVAACNCLVPASSPAAADEESGFESLTGETAREMWAGYGMDDAGDPWPATWKLEDGVLHALGGRVDLKTRREYGDFDLRFEWKAPPGAN